MARKHVQRFNGSTAFREAQQKARDADFRQIEKSIRDRKLREDGNGNAVERPLLGEEADHGSVLRGFFEEASGTIRDFNRHHPDTIGVSRQREPKSIHSSPGRSKNGSIPRPKSPPKKPDGNGGRVNLWKGNEAQRLNHYLHRHYGIGDL